MATTPMNVKAIPILDVAESLGISVTGKTASCLRNADSNPSMKFDLDQGLFNCFSCGAGGSVIDLVMHAQGTDAAAAIVWLKEHFDGGAPAKDFSPIYEAVTQLGDLQPAALDYLTVKRGISREVLDVAYLSKDLRAGIVDTLLKKFPEAELIESGLYPKSEKSGRHYFSFFDCEFLFPYRQRGRVVHLQGRTENGAKRGKYIHLPGRPVPLIYGAHRIEGLPSGSEVYIAEGLFDALTLATIGLPAVGIPGAARLSKPEARASLARLLKDYVPIHIMQGDTAAESLACDIATALPECRVLKPPSQYKDLNEWHVAIGGLTKEILDRNLLVVLVNAGSKPEPSEEPPPEAYEDEAPVQPPSPLSVSLSEVEAQPVSWLWPNVLPIGCGTLLSGDPGCGKTWLALDLVARLSKGTRWIDGASIDKPGNIVYLSVEDDASNTIRPRIDSLGGDPSHIFVYNIAQPIHLDLSEAGGLGRLEKDIVRIGNVRLLVLDPIIDFSGKVNPNASEEVRALLTPLIGMAGRLGFALIIIGHLNKAQSMSAIYRAGGSTGGWLGKCRAALMVFRDVEDKGLRHVVAMKANLSTVDPPQIEFRINEGRVEGHVSTEDVDVDAHLNPDARRRPREKASAVEWLKGLFEERDKIPAAEVEEAARDQGISRNTLQRAKISGEYLSKREKISDGTSQWFWVKTK